MLGIPELMPKQLSELLPFLGERLLRPSRHMPKVVERVDEQPLSARTLGLLGLLCEAQAQTLTMGDRWHLKAASAPRSRSFDGNGNAVDRERRERDALRGYLGVPSHLVKPLHRLLIAEGCIDNALEVNVELLADPSQLLAHIVKPSRSVHRAAVAQHSKRLNGQIGSVTPDQQVGLRLTPGKQRLKRHVKASRPGERALPHLEAQRSEPSLIRAPLDRLAKDG